MYSLRQILVSPELLLPKSDCLGPVPLTWLLSDVLTTSEEQHDIAFKSLVSGT